MAREYFCAYHSYRQSVEPLTDAEKGRLFIACLDYSMSGAIPDLRGNERFVWPTIKQRIDSDARKYEEHCEKQRANSRMRWDAVGCGGTFGNPKHANIEDIYISHEKERKRNKGTERKESDTAFNVFWTAYPKKAGKKDARRAWDKLSPGAELAAQIMAGLDRCKQSRQWRDGFVPNASTFLNGERWNDELPAQQQKQVGYEQHTYDDSELSKLLVDLDAEGGADDG